MKNSDRFPWLIILPLLLPGLLVAIWRCSFRNIAEKQNIYIETVVDFEELRQLARNEGWQLSNMLKKAKQAGASSVAISENTLASLESEGRISILSYQEMQKLALEDSFKVKIPAVQSTLGALWIHSTDDMLLDKIEQSLSWKLPSSKILRIQRNFLRLNKSSEGVKTRIGLGFSQEYLDLVKENNLGIVLRIFNYPNLTASAATKIINSLPAPASISALLFAEEEVLGNRGELLKIISLFKNRSYRIGWIEFDTQKGIKAYLKTLSKSRPFVRVHSISRKEITKIYNVKRATARWIRAVRDRSIKMLYIRCFYQDEKSFISDLVQFNLNYIHNITSNLNSYGYKIANNHEQRLFEPRHLVGVISRSEQLAIGLSLLLGLPFLFIISYKPKSSEQFYIYTAIITLITFFALPTKLFTAIAGIAGAFAYACIGVIFSIDSLSNSENHSQIKRHIYFFLRLIIPSILGGILIAGIYAETEFLLKFSQFRGIKLAFILPLLWTFIWSIKKFGKDFLSFFSKPLNPITMTLLLAVLSGLALYILRSGNVTFLKPSALEDSIRTFLENTLFARPRNKEFLIGYPTAFLFIFFYLRKKYSILPILAIFIQMGQVSVVNTFCHFHSPLFMSITRTFNGLWLGILIGIAILPIFMLSRLIFYFGAPKRNSIFAIGYFGFTNYGDELLWRTFANFTNTKFPDKSLIVLHKTGNAIDIPANTELIKRSDVYGILEGIIRAKAIIIPGGGVLQSSTSEKSLLYYLFLLLLGRISKTKIILLAQGMGPWHQPMNRFASRMLNNILLKADHFSLRDKFSKSALVEIEYNDIDKVETSSDLSFNNAKAKREQPTKAPETLRILTILRGSVPEAESIAKALIEITDELDTIELVPAAMQEIEDESVWHKVGWENNIELLSATELNQFHKYDLVVSMRLHGCIMATMSAIPWIGIEYDPKVKHFAETIKWDFSFQPNKIDKKFLEDQLTQIGARWPNLKNNLVRETQKLSRRIHTDLEAVERMLSESNKLNL